MKKFSNLILVAAIATTALIGFGCASTSTTASAPAPAAQTTTQPANTMALNYQWFNSNTTVTAVQTTPANASVLTIPQTPGAATKPTLKFVKVDSEETAGEDGKGANAVDGDPATLWHTQWQDTNPPCPHEITIELVPPATIKGFTYLPRQDDSDHGMIKDYEFYVSDDGDDFGQPVSKGTFENSKDLKTVTFDARKCRFIKLKALSEVNDAEWTSAAEIGVVPVE
ncbi:MAG TPA: discoidin domain-containing protein [Verrucomicrobiae bacterium]